MARRPGILCPGGMKKRKGIETQKSTHKHGVPQQGMCVARGGGGGMLWISQGFGIPNHQPQDSRDRIKLGKPQALLRTGFPLHC